MSEQSPVIVDVENGIMTITLNRRKPKMRSTKHWRKVSPQQSIASNLTLSSTWRL